MFIFLLFLYTLIILLTSLKLQFVHSLPPQHRFPLLFPLDSQSVTRRESGAKIERNSFWISIGRLTTPLILFSSSRMALQLFLRSSYPSDAPHRDAIAIPQEVQLLCISGAKALALDAIVTHLPLLLLMLSYLLYTKLSKWLNLGFPSPQVTALATSIKSSFILIPHHLFNCCLRIHRNFCIILFMFKSSNLSPRY